MSSTPVPTPPGPFSDFEFAFDPASSNIFPPQPPLPPSADLFSASETTDLLGFLDKFNWDFDVPDAQYVDQQNHTQQPQQPQLPPSNLSKSYAPYNLTRSPDPSSLNRGTTRASRTEHSRGRTLTPIDEPSAFLPDPRDDSRSHSSGNSNASSTPPARPSPSRNLSEHSISSQPASTITPAPPRSRPLLSTPQKRLNHIMSEQKRRNAIRDGYAQLIGLIAPAGSAPGIGMPTRGRPKGSGSRGKGRSKGKSGVLFRAVEYCRWLEEGRDALKQEVLLVEQAAGLHH